MYQYPKKTSQLLKRDILWLYFYNNYEAIRYGSLVAKSTGFLAAKKDISVAVTS